MTDQHKQEEQSDHPVEGMEMGDQGPSYSSSYNESTPGEIAANRRTSLREDEASEDQHSNPTER